MLDTRSQFIERVKNIDSHIDYVVSRLKGTNQNVPSIPVLSLLEKTKMSLCKVCKTTLDEKGDQVLNNVLESDIVCQVKDDDMPSPHEVSASPICAKKKNDPQIPFINLVNPPTKKSKSVQTEPINLSKSNLINESILKNWMMDSKTEPNDRIAVSRTINSTAKSPSRSKDRIIRPSSKDSEIKMPKSFRITQESPNRRVVEDLYGVSTKVFPEVAESNHRKILRKIARGVSKNSPQKTLNNTPQNTSLTIRHSEEFISTQTNTPKNKPTITSRTSSVSQKKKFTIDFKPTSGLNPISIRKSK